MKALTFQGKEKITFETVSDPKIESAGDVIIKMTSCAICGSDLHVYHEREKGIDRGTVMGHEFAGEIVETGNSVRKLNIGDRVMSPFTTSCGTCFYCQSGLTCRCVRSQLFGWVEKGHGLHGGQAEYVRVPLAESTLMKIPEGIREEEALLLGDVMSTGFFCARQAEVKETGTYVVVGCGPVGLMAVLGAVNLRARNIIAIDTVPERLAKARDFGATALHALNDPVTDMIRDLTEGRGADGVMEAVGSYQAVRTAIDLVRPGGVVASVGVCNDDHLAFSPVEAYNKNLTYKIGRCPARYMMEQLIPLVQEKKYNIASIFTHRMKLEEGAAGYTVFSGRQDHCLKVLLRN